MTHAGIPPMWSVDHAEALAHEVETVIRGKRRIAYFESMYGNKPDSWDDSLRGMDRWRAITNFLTRVRLMNAAGRMDFAHKGGLNEAPPEWVPWYELPRREALTLKLLFGHWAAIEGHSGVAETRQANLFAVAQVAVEAGGSILFEVVRRTIRTRAITAKGALTRPLRS